MILALLVVLAGCAQTTQPDATPAATPEQTAPQGTETEQPDASAEPGTPDEPAKDTLVVALSADALSMDPARHTTYPTGTVLFHIYDPPGYPRRQRQHSALVGRILGIAG